MASSDPIMFRRFAFRLSDQTYVLWKQLRSLFKSEWSFTDYPIRLKEQKADSPFEGSRFKTPLFHAYILNWHVSGTGETREEALQNLERSYTERKSRLLAKGESPPRPGTRIPIEFASQEKMNAHQALAEDFIRRVLHLEWAWLSDDSCLSHFHADKDSSKYILLINEIYGVDISDIEDGELWQIFARIESARREQ